MSWYQDHCLPQVINLACSSRALGKIRAEVVPWASGRVLEVGMGGGLNLPFYDSAKVQSICGLEPCDGMREKARKAMTKATIPVELLSGSAEEIPMDDESVDSVVLTFTLCTIGDWRRAMEEIGRVMKPGAGLIFCEHGLAPDRGVAKWQERINRYWKAVAGGCNLNRPISQLISEAGFLIEEMHAGYLPGLPKIAGFVYRGRARKPLQRTASRAHR